MQLFLEIIDKKLDGENGLGESTGIFSGKS